MGGFPSGQREQTVNLLSTTSVVRIHLLPPSNSPAIWLGFCLAGGTVDEPCAQIYADSVMRHLPYCLIFADNSTMRAGSAACTARRLRPSLPLVMRRNARQNAPLYNALHLWRTSTSDHLYRIEAYLYIAFPLLSCLNESTSGGAYGFLIYDLQAKINGFTTAFPCKQINKCSI